MAAREPVQPFRYGRTYFVQRFVGLVALLTALLVVLGVQFSTPAAWLVALGVFAFLYLLVFGLSPLLTSHALSGSRLVLRQGWYFAFRVPLRTLGGIAAYEGRVPLGLRARLGEDVLYVTGSGHGLVEIAFARRRFWQALGARVGRIVFDVERREAFLEAVAERRRSLTPVQAKRAYPELRD